jgi:hypothetical protein
MPIGAHLKHRCDIYRAELVTDEYENERRDFDPDAEPHIEGLCCFYTVKERVRRDTESGELVSVSQVMLLVPHDADVVVGDRVSDIEIETETLGGPFDVKNARPRRRARSMSHLSLILQEVA